MPFQDFLRQFRALLSAQAGNLQDPGARVKRALGYVFGSARKQLDTFRPTQLETRDFIDYLIFAIRAENKERSQDRCLALTKVLDYNANPGTPYFSGIKPPVFAFQLALRVREPSLINQREIGICGENSLMIYFAKNTPSAFAEYAISLMRNGWGNFHGLMVRPSPEIVESFIPEVLREQYKAFRESYTRSSYEKEYTEKLAAADFVIMGSLTMGFFGSIKEGSWPKEVCERLSKAGLQNVENKVNPVSEPTKHNLTDACAAVEAGKLVMLCVYPGFVQELQSYKLLLARIWDSAYLKRGSGKTWEQALEGDGGLDLNSNVKASAKKGNPKSRHWILVTHLAETEGKVTIKLYSWQHPVQGTLSLETFLTHYEGYVAADPPADETGN